MKLKGPSNHLNYIICIFNSTNGFKFEITTVVTEIRCEQQMCCKKFLGIMWSWLRLLVCLLLYCNFPNDICIYIFFMKGEFYFFYGRISLPVRQSIGNVKKSVRNTLKKYINRTQTQILIKFMLIWIHGGVKKILWGRVLY